jgi:serine protease Do
MFVTAYRDNTTVWGLLLVNKSWTTQDKYFDVEIIAGPEKNPSNRKTLTRQFFGTDTGGIAVNDLTANEMNTLAFDGEATVWFVNKNGGKRIGAFRIDGSAAIIRAVQACLKARAPNEQVATTPPKQDKKEEGTSGSGTGFFVAPKYVLTSEHVIANCSNIFVKYPGFARAPAYVKGRDEKTDLALLKTDMHNEGVAQFRMRGRLGELVYSYGFPYASLLSSGGTFTSGGLSALTGFKDDSTLIQISTPIQPGNSGGPLMDSSGVVIGVSQAVLGTLTAAVANGGAVPQNVNFAVSSGTAINFLGTRGIDVEIASLLPKLEPEAIAEAAKKFTVQISCESPALNKGS